jgi:hypothetical protein
VGGILDIESPSGALPSRPHDGQFASFTQWVNKATSWIGGTNPLCADARGRICRNGADMMRARDEDAFPARYWFDEGPRVAPKDRREDQAAHHKAMKLQYPWRYAR